MPTTFADAHSTQHSVYRFKHAHALTHHVLLRECVCAALRFANAFFYTTYIRNLIESIKIKFKEEKKRKKNVRTYTCTVNTDTRCERMV